MRVATLTHMSSVMGVDNRCWAGLAAATLALAFALPEVTSGQQREDPTSGASLYRAFCVSCHGTNGKGGGPIADTLPQKVPDLTTISRSNGGVYPRDRVLTAVRNGGTTGVHSPGGMSYWEKEFAVLEPQKGAAEQRLRALVDYIETLQVKP
jgi:mono/diheme cytochrome c family protein